MKFPRSAALSQKLIAVSLSVAFVGAPLQPALADNAPTIINPTVFTYQSTAPVPDKASGALTQRIPIEIPPGRNGLQPDVSLTYNNQSASDGIVGYGWSLSIPYIERLNKTGVDKLYNDNYFASSLSGELATTAPSTPTQYRSRIDDGRFVAYTFANNKWTAYDKSGTRYYFGTTTAAQFSDRCRRDCGWNIVRGDLRRTSG